MIRNCFLFCLFALMLLSSGAIAAGKITSDPNAPGTKAEQPAKLVEADERLNQLITYDSTSKRLHYIIEDLSKMSGVPIFCGSNKDNWQVRDIPVIVCVKDLKLGALLQTIADATHTRFIPETIEREGKKQRVYRIYRTAKEQDDIASFLKTQHDEDIAQASWAWDVLVSAAKAPVSVEKLDARQREVYSVARPLSTILAGLGSQAKERVLAGIPIYVRGSDPLFESAVREICFTALKNQCNNSTQLSGGPKLEELTDEAIRNACIDIKITDSNYYASTDIVANINARLDQTYLSGGHFITGYANTMSRIKDIQLPPRPKRNSPRLLQFEAPSDKWTWIFKLKNDADVKIKMNPPERKPEPTFADYISAISKISGVNIVMEDFISDHFGRLGVTNIKGKFIETSLLQALKSLPSVRWFNNSDDNAYLGWSFDWRKSHYSLLPESYLIYMQNKISGDGLNIDDTAGLLSLTPEQFNYWIDNSKDFTQLCSFNHSENLWLWRLYNSLTPKDKIMAKSETGIPLSKLDTNWVISVVKEWQKGSSANLIRRISASDNTDEIELKNYSTLTNPEWIRSLVLRVKSEPAKSYRAVTVDSYSGSISWNQDPVPQVLNLQSCWIEASGERNGEQAVFTTSQDLAFPIYSAKRMSELQEKAKTQK